MKDASKIRVLTASHVKQSAGGIAIKAGVRAGLADLGTKESAKMGPGDTLVAVADAPVALTVRDVVSAKMLTG